jgi:hypothetical protein
VSAIWGQTSEVVSWIGLGILVAVLVGAVYVIRRKPPKH